MLNDVLKVNRFFCGEKRFDLRLIKTRPSTLVEIFSWISSENEMFVGGGRERREFTVPMNVFDRLLKKIFQAEDFDHADLHETTLVLVNETNQRSRGVAVHRLQKRYQVVFHRSTRT